MVLGLYRLFFSTAVLCCLYGVSVAVYGQPQVVIGNSNTATNDTNSETNEVDDNDILSRFELGEELILSVLLDNRTIGEVFTVVQENGIFVELDSIINVLEFPIEKRNGQYLGWYIRKGNAFELKIANFNSPTTLGYDQMVVQPTRAQLVVLNNIVYVHASLIKDVFKISIDYDFTNQQIILEPSIKLPLQERISRRKRDVRGRKADNVAKYPELFRGYEILSPQTFDLSSSLYYSENTDKLRANYSVLGRREIAYLNTRFFFSGTDDKAFSNARLNFSKRNINSPIMESLGLSKIEFGDVTPVSIGFSSSGGQSTGIAFSNIENTRTSNQQNISIAGEVLSGWDVELYRNDILVGQFFDLQTGRYEFNDVQLFVGENSFEIIKYGPQGEIERETISRLLTREQRTDDKWEYSASITRPNSTLLGVDNIADAPDQSNLGLALSGRKRLTENSAFRFGVSSEVYDNDTLESLSLGLDGRLSERLFYNASLEDDPFRQSVRFGLKASLFGHQANASLTTYRRKATLDDEESTSHFLNVDNQGNFTFGLGSRLSYQNTLSFSKTESNTSFALRNTLGLDTQFGRLNHTLSYEDANFRSLGMQDVQSDPRVIGNISYSNRFGRVFTRLNSSYIINEQDNPSGFTGYSLDLSYKYNKNLSFAYEANYQKPRDLLFHRLNVNWLHDFAIISANFTQSDLLGLGAGITARFSVGGEPFDTDIFYNNRPLTGGGTLVVRVFLDTNLNGRFDPHESVIENAQVIAKQSIAKAKTDGKGLAILSQLGTIAPTDITVDASDTDNPFLQPLIEGVSIQPRQGFVDKLDFPMVETSEIEGTVVGPNTSANAYINVNLIDHKNNIIQTVKSEYDGYFYFSDVAPGKYRLRLADKALNDRRMTQVKDEIVTIEGLSDIYTIEDIRIEPIPHIRVYFAQIAEFDNLQMLKSYVGLLKLRIRHPEVFKLRHLNYDNSDKYKLVSEEMSDEFDALEKCEVYRSLRLNCEIIEEEVPTTLAHNIGTNIANTSP